MWVGLCPGYAVRAGVSCVCPLPSSPDSSHVALCPPHPVLPPPLPPFPLPALPAPCHYTPPPFLVWCRKGKQKQKHKQKHKPKLTFGRQTREEETESEKVLQPPLLPPGQLLKL